MFFGYCRVSKEDRQNASLQLKAFEEIKVDKVLEETASGRHWTEDS